MNDVWTKDIGIQLREDGGTDGEIIGVMWKPSSVDAKNVTRCSARKAYYDPSASRANLDILVTNFVARVITVGSRAVGVDIVTRRTSAKTTVSANKEVILAAGAIHTPQILQLSGVGPASVLESLNITVVQDLPGVGANFQDHPTVRGFDLKCKDP